MIPATAATASRPTRRRWLHRASKRGGGGISPKAGAGAEGSLITPMLRARGAGRWPHDFFSFGATAGTECT